MGRFMQKTSSTNSMWGCRADAGMSVQMYRNLKRELGGADCLLSFREGCSGVSGGGALISILMTVLLTGLVDK